MRHAIIQSNIVQSVVVWDGVSAWSPPEGTELLQLAANEPCGSGWTYEANATPRFIPSIDIPPE